MIELVLYFALGFLSAVFLAALVAPAIWRRAAMLTRRRIEASVPLTTNEIRAEHDGLRAQHAVELRRLEMELKAATERASLEAANNARGRKDVKLAADERSAAKSELNARESELRESRDEVRKLNARIDALVGALEKTEGLLQAQRENYDDLARQFEEASMSSSARQIELVARETEISRLVSDMSTLKGQHKSSSRLSRDAEGRIRAAQETATAERRRAEELNTKVLQLLATVSDGEERLERREREINRLRERLRPIITAPDDENHDLRLADLASENVRLEAEIADLSERLESSRSTRGSGSKTSTRESSQRMREQLAELAAQVVAMTEVIEGPGSPISELLDKAGEDSAGDGQPSLAARIRALRSAVTAAKSKGSSSS